MNFSKIMKMRLDQNSVKVGLKPSYTGDKVAKGDVSRFRKLKAYARKNLKGITGTLVVGVGGVITSMLLFGRGSMEDGANTMMDIGESVWDVAESMGGAVEPALKGVSKIIESGSAGLNFIADNLILVCVVVVGLIVGYPILTRRNV